MRQPCWVGIVGKYELSILDRVYQRMGHFSAYRRATQAATDPSDFAHECLADVVGAVNHDGATHGVVIEARLKALHPQRIPVAAKVNIARAKQTQARRIAARIIGKRCSKGFTRIATVRNPFCIQKRVRGKIKYPQAFLSGGF